ncbi:MAG TPA: diaminopimelate decarboxylase, partial [Acidimicrobiales bacterium]|nr:diaminopimelate decarboxylase [Acidimicrobiales bacterium]
MTSAPIDAALLPDTARLTPDDVEIAGVSLRALAAQHGTPLFVYDEATMRFRAAEAARSFDPGVAYGSKAFLCGAMARLVVDEGLWIDVATGGELDLVLRAGVPPSRVIVHGNNKSAAEVERAVAVGVHRLVVDNFDEVARIARVVSPTSPLDCLVRVTPGVEAHTHDYVRTGQEDTKFGFSIASGEARVAIDALRAVPGVTLHGVHAHVGSQIFDDRAHREATAILVDFTARDGFD